MKSVLAAVGLFAVGVSPAAADCVTQRIYFHLGFDGQAYTETDNGSSCRFGFNASTVTIFDSVRVVTQPKHGTTARADRLRVRYTPKKGFVGEDKLVLEVCGKQRGRAGCSTITYRIAVK